MQLFKVKRVLIILHDILWVPAAIYLAYWFRFNLQTVPESYYPAMRQLIVFAMPIHAFTFWLFGCYRGIWRFASLPDLWRLLRAVAMGALVVSVALFLYSRFIGVPRSAIVLYPILLFIGVSGSRAAYRMLRTHRFSLDREERPRALVIGAGRAGNFLVRDLLEHGPFTAVGLIDDNPSMEGTDVHGVRVVGKVSDLPVLIKSFDAQVVLIAMPSAPRATMDEIVRICSERKVICRTLPTLNELADGRVEVSRLRPVTVEDLLGRAPVKLDEHAVGAYITGKCVAVTGGGGSIGSELCRQILAHQPSSLMVIDSSEFNLYSIEAELKKKYPGRKILPLLADIRVRETVENIFAQCRPQVVFHAAAYKHVPMVEENIIEGLRNNAFGTKVVADAAAKYEVSTFVLVSTDKTVNPTNVMGASKRIAEVYCQTLNNYVRTHYITTRFGNVLGSTGSVVPLFEKQIKDGGPVTVTHPDIARFFMTIPEAASLILQAGAMGKGGEIYVLDMGEPVKILELAENMIRLSGLEPGRDIKVQYIGLRPGEKMHEELFYAKEELVGTGHPKLMLANCMPCEWSGLQADLLELQKAVERFDDKAALRLIQRIVPEFVRNVPPGAEIIPLQNPAKQLPRS
ncbi:MAG TPA: nucleoside-diphosphate sugar epimerase/dehydratase [Gammaproteobacteria bacterium]|nr:nucleoside-diphosphate sugar epimerase/dehydratase [Gammaproteobacteria bacterium]